jgi:predicted metal-dependent HD superfamily phosphohydrolase
MNWIEISQMDWIDRLNLKWRNLWQFTWNSVIEESYLNDREIDRVFQLLIIAYTQPDRYYHNLKHIYDVLTTIERFADRLQNPISVMLAAWFHDFVYDSRSANNEIESAKLAGELLQDIVVSKGSIDRVQQLILATQGHQTDLRDNDLCIFLDADLAILGTNPEQYQIYARSIRHEYSWVTDELYREGRVRVLEKFLQRDRLYYTELLFEELESCARLNIQTEIQSISAYN